MIHIISGFGRSGTTAMVDAISQSIPVAYDPEIDEFFNRNLWAGRYRPQREGFFEFKRSRFNRDMFPAGYEGHVIKVLFGGLLFLYPSQYRIAVMLRHPHEIRKSYRKMMISETYDDPILRSWSNYLNFFADLGCRVRARSDVLSLDYVWFADLCADPEGELGRLKESGWPIDPIKCATRIDPSLYREKVA